MNKDKSEQCSCASLEKCKEALQRIYEICRSSNILTSDYLAMINKIKKDAIGE